MIFPVFNKKKQYKIRHEFGGGAIWFRLVNRKGSVCHVKNWLTVSEAFSLDSTAETSVAVLLQLVENGIAEVNANEIEIPYAHLHRVPLSEMEVLDFPEPYPFAIEIRSEGTLGDSNFRYNLRYIGADGRELISVKRDGPLVRIGTDRVHLLDQDTYLLTEAVDGFNRRTPDEKTFTANLLALPEIKALASAGGVKLDAYLRNESVVTPKSVQVDLNLIDPDTLEITPIVEGKRAEDFIEKFDRQRTVTDVYHFDQSDGSRERLLFDDEKKQALHEVKQHRVLKGCAKDAFLDAPREFLRSDAFDLEDLSDRVRAIGAYRVRFYPFTRPKPGSWLPEIGFMIESDDPNADITHLPIQTLEELESLAMSFREAQAEKLSYFEFDGHRFPIDHGTVEKIDHVRQALARLQLVSEEAVDSASASAKDKKFLLIYDNVEEIEYHTAGIDLYDTAIVEIPRSLKVDVYLYPHQNQGISWLQFLMNKGYRGGLLADDMGLGKTLQILTFLAWYFETQPDAKPVLIVAPVALLVNWEEEYHKFFHQNGMGDVLPLHGSNLARFKLEAAPSGREYGMDSPHPTLDVEAITRNQLVLTTYEAVRDYQFSMATVDWGIVVSDETQKIKTPGALVTNALKALKTDFVIASTATPVENSLLDLWCIIDFVQPGYLGSLKGFTQNFIAPLNSGEVARDELSDRLREKLKTIMVRRIKGDILKDLPRKEAHTHQIVMGEVQLDRYLQEVQAALKVKQEIQRSRTQMLSVLANLRAICAHPILPDTSEEHFSTDDLLADSTKLVKAIEFLKEIQEIGEKAIVFERSRQMQRILQRVVRAIFELTPPIINGDVPGIVPRRSRRLSRKAMIDQFQAVLGFNVIIVSPEAAGVGLNITEANHVLHYTRLWNPAKEDQATDRVYRIGQKRDVHVHYLLAVAPNDQFETFDVKLDYLLHEKRSLSRDFLLSTEKIDVQPQALMDAVFSEMESGFNPAV